MKIAHSETAHWAGTTAAKERIHVLVVADTLSQARRFSAPLTLSDGAPFLLSYADTLAEALAFLVQTPPDAVLLDLRLADGDFSALHAVHTQAPELPVVVTAGSADDDLAERCLQAGAQDYVVTDDGTVPCGLVRTIRYAIARKQQEGRFRSLAQNAPDIIFRFRLSPAAGYEYVSPAATAITGYTPDEFYAAPALICDYLLHPLDRHQVAEPGSDAWLSDEPFLTARLEPYTLRFVHKDGRVIWIELHLTHRHDEAGDLVAVEGIIRDVSKQQAALQDLRKSEERINQIVRASLLPIVTTTLADGKILEVNDSAGKLFGFSRAEMVGHTTVDLGLWAQPEARQEMVATVLEKGRCTKEVLMQTRSGQHRIILGSFEAFDANGLPCLLIIMHDITNRNEAERALQMRTNELDDRVKELQCLFAITNLIETSDLALVDVLQAIADLIPFGWRHPEQTYVRIVHQTCTFYSREFAETSWFLSQSLKVNGNRIGAIDVFVQAPSASAATPFLAEEIELLATIAKLLGDYLEREEAARLLRESRQHYHQLISNAPLGIAVFDQAGQLTLTNPAFRDLTGLIDQTEQDGIVDHSLVDRFLAETGLACRLTACIRQKERTVGEVTYALNGTSAVWLRVHLTPLCQETGEVSAVQALFEDVTQHRETERQISHRQKLEAVGALAAGIAHEINTPIQFIGDNTHFLSESFQDLLRLLALYQEVFRRNERTKDPRQDPIRAAETEIDFAYLQQEVPEALAQTLEGVERVSSIVNAMRVFAHPVSGQKIPADLNEAIQHTLTVARNEYKYVADVSLDLDPNLPLTPCDLGEINQVFLNLIVNAAHAIKAKQEADPGAARGLIAFKTRCVDGSVEISVSDTGTGIAPELENRIFDPFFTTKPVGEGTGQGLSIAHAIVEKEHGGHIRLQTALGRGTTFTIQLPLHPEEEISHG